MGFAVRRIDAVPAWVLTSKDIAMQLDSYLEIFTTMYGWAFANILGEIITGTGIIVLPFALIVFNGFKDAKENGVGASGGVMGVIESVQTKLIIAMFVLSVCFATTPATSLMSINLSYTPPASSSDGSPQTGSRDGGTNSGFDRAMADATNGSMSPTGSLYYVPAWWFTAMAISSGINNAARDGLRSAGRDIRMVEDMARTATIEDPRLLADIQRFYSECFIPARSRYLQLGPDELSGSGRAIVADTNKDYGPTDVDWMGSQLFRKEPGFYDTMRSYNPVAGFAIDASRDKDFERTAPAGSPEASFTLPQWGRPTCNQWWESSNGLRSRMVDHSATWRKLTSAAADAFSWTSDDQRLDTFAKLAQTKANPHMVDTDRIMGNDYDTLTKIGRTFTGAASTVGLSIKAVMASVEMMPLMQGLPMMQALILMGLYMFLPLITFLSGFDLKIMFYGAIGIFTVKFWAVMWMIANWVDAHLIAALYPGMQGNMFIQEITQMTNGAIPPGYKRMLLNTLLMAMFVFLPLLWSGMMAWIGIRVGQSLNELARPAKEASSEATKATGQAVTKGVGRRK
ncbi:conjugal transfer protein TraG N-terminal domain-containing protein [Variovorax sp. ZS18.2.2]|uniref:conjugal transfer protein TraG N-terminal domain-containing protein n=1 Tax=Variovorax sp. ZS18.2.2 TaxID=2971255 RepID=UPI002150EA4D|nr:conjugal transfer protein TraG N-terminal domain-containing protein [Variovorax sp. ZS18.2.2]MCR6480999.1 conjugal transfer protein TraG N-terminal domain-containing protein [Variovorax sp. ZS18.2.2]